MCYVDLARFKSDTSSMKAPNSDEAKRLLSNTKSVEALYSALDGRKKSIPVNGHYVHLKKITRQVTPLKKDAKTSHPG